MPYDEGGRLSELHAIAGHLERDDARTACCVRPGCRAALAAPVRATLRSTPHGAEPNGA